MVDSKLITIVRKFKKEELVRFADFMASPYLNYGRQAKEAAALFHYIHQLAPAYSEEALAKERVFKAIYPEQTFSAGKLNKLMTYLLKLVHHFIYTESQKSKEEISKELAVAQFYRERRLATTYQNHLKKFQRYLKEERPSNQAYLHNCFLIEREIFTFESSQNKRKLDLHLPQTIQQLDVYYLFTKLEYTVLLLAQNIHTSINLKATILDAEQLFQLNAIQERLEEPALRILYQAYQFLKHYKEDSTEAFFELKRLLKNYPNSLSFEQKKNLYALLRIYISGKCNQGQEELLPEAFRLYREHLEEGFLFQNGKLSPSIIRNLVSLGLLTEQFDWVTSFLETYKNKITGTQNPKEVYNFNLANFYFNTQKYEQALELLNYDYDDLYYKLAAKRMEIKIYFDLNSPLLEPKLDAFKVYIFRVSKEKLPDKPKQGNNNFVDLLRQILSPKTMYNELRINKLIEQVNAKKIVAEKLWLIEKLNQLKARL